MRRLIIRPYPHLFVFVVVHTETISSPVAGSCQHKPSQLWHLGMTGVPVSPVGIKELLLFEISHQTVPRLLRHRPGPKGVVVVASKAWLLQKRLTSGQTKFPQKHCLLQAQQWIYLETSIFTKLTPEHRSSYLLRSPCQRVCKVIKAFLGLDLTVLEIVLHFKIIDTHGQNCR